MKKTFITLSLISVSFFNSCVKEELPQPVSPDVKTVLSVGTSETKTTLGAVSEGYRQMYWANGDKINVNGHDSGALTGLTANTATKADFTFVQELTSPYKALYPASIYKNATTVTLPHNAGNQVIPLGGVSESTSFSLSPLTAMLEVKIKLKATEPDTDHIALIEVSTASTRMSGDFTINESYNTLTPADSPTGNDLAVQITGDWTLAAEATSFLIPVPAGEYSFTVKVMDKNGHYMTKSTTSVKEFTAGQIKPLKEFEFIPDHEGGVEISSADQLIAFAKSYKNGDYSELGRDLIVTLTADLSFDASSSAAFNATKGIGAGGNDDPLFTGVFDGGNHSINGLTATVPVFARVGQYGTVRNLTMGSTSSLSYSESIDGNRYLAAVAGYCKGNITDCTNNASVTCSSTTRSSGTIYMGGLVARQNTSGTISGCVNNADVTCSTTVGSGDVYIGGIVGSVERPAAGNTALIQYCTNWGSIKCGVDSSDPAQAYPLHMGGIVGWIYSTASSDKMTITGLVNKGNVTKTNNNAKKNGTPVILGGIVGGIHGSAITDACGQVEIKDSYVYNCTIQNGDFNNNLDETGSFTGGFVGIARGNNLTDISVSNNCYVYKVDVICRRGIAGGFAAWLKGATLTSSNVLNSSVKGSLAQLRRGGGLAGQINGNVSLKDCTVTLTKDSQYSLYGQADVNNDVNLGGIVGTTTGSNTIDGCQAFVSLMYIGGTNKTEAYGWIVGKTDSSTTIKDCGLGGTYGQTTATLTLSSEDYSSYVCGSGSPTLDGDKPNKYWNGSDAPSGTRTETVTISEYATSHGWTNDASESPQTITQGVVTLTASNAGGNLNGNYNTQWRFYQARGGGLTVSVPVGYSLVSATFTYEITNTGVLLAPNGSQVPSGTKCSLSGSSAFFTVGNTGTKTNGQVRFTKFVIEYE